MQTKELVGEIRESLLDDQTKLQKKMQESGLNLVNCCFCGAPIIHKTGATEAVCYECLEPIEFESCSDIFY